MSTDPTTHRLTHEAAEQLARKLKNFPITDEDGRTIGRVEYAYCDDGAVQVEAYLDYDALPELPSNFKFSLTEVRPEFIKHFPRPGNPALTACGEPWQEWQAAHYPHADTESSVLRGESPQRGKDNPRLCLQCSSLITTNA